MIDSFMGKLTLQDGTIVGAVLNLSDDILSVAAEGTTVGTWPLKYCRVSRLNETEFVITIDGEPTTFLPVDAFRFAKVAAERFSASSLADRINVIRSMPLEPEVVVMEPIEMPVVGQPVVESSPRLPLTIAAMVVAVATLITLAGRGELEGTTDTTFAPVPRPTVVSVLATGPEVFRLTPESFRARWNAAAAVIEPSLNMLEPFSAGAFRTDVTPLIAFRGGEAADGTVESVKVAITATDDVDEGELGVRAIRIALAVANPGMSESARIGVLRSLGFSAYPESLQVEGVRAELAGDGMRYELRYIGTRDSDVLLFSIWEDPVSG